MFFHAYIMTLFVFMSKNSYLLVASSTEIQEWHLGAQQIGGQDYFWRYSTDVESYLPCVIVVLQLSQSPVQMAVKIQQI